MREQEHPPEERGFANRTEFRPLPEMYWDEIRDPGCYLHLASGHLARIHAEDLNPSGAPATPILRMARLSPDPETPLERLRAIARAHRYLINF